jgi:Zn-dependent metalloprotease
MVSRAAALTLGAVLVLPASGGAQTRSFAGIAATESEAVRAWTERIDTLAARGELRAVSEQNDADFPGRRHLRYEQRLGGVRVFGAQLVRQLDETGRTLSVFGRLLEAAPTPPAALVAPVAAVAAAEAAMGRDAGAVGAPELVVLALPERSLLAYMLWVRRDEALRRTFVDAASGAVAFAYDDLRTAAVVGVGTGVWGDRKKVSADSAGSGFLADDKLRPPALLTYDMRFDGGATELFLRRNTIAPAFLATDSDNDWRDGGVVDAHVYAGWTYDYYFKRHGRRGIDGRDLVIRSVTHFVPESFALANAFWDPFTNAAFYYDGDPDYGVFSAALDVVAHELTHGVTQYSWDGIYLDEPGALNEAFSDIMATGAEFFHEPAGNGRRMADYWMGEDLARRFDPARLAFRSLAEPALLCSRLGCDPDHYASRYRGPEDNGGVHVNSAIANHAFYLLVEGGTNRTSGARVAGLGGANRERAERIFYRGFTSYLTPSASFSDARAATLQAARELYGASSNEAAQTAAAWSAVGVQ